MCCAIDSLLNYSYVSCNMSTLPFTAERKVLCEGYKLHGCRLKNVVGILILSRPIIIMTKKEVMPRLLVQTCRYLARMRRKSFDRSLKKIPSISLQTL